MSHCDLRKMILVVVITLLCRNTLQSSAKQYHMPSFKAHWFKASEFCRMIGMQLVTIRSSDEHNAVTNFIQRSNIFSNGANSFWLGGTDLADEGIFLWAPTGQYITYSIWAPGEPNNAGGSEDCIQLLYFPNSQPMWAWNDKSCKPPSMFFVCETPSRDCMRKSSINYALQQSSDVNSNATFSVSKR